ncbi:MAG: hypothetical protein QW559_00865 [Candidatus Woesearchaeota archaeon]
MAEQDIFEEQREQYLKIHYNANIRGLRESITAELEKRGLTVSYFDSEKLKDWIVGKSTKDISENSFSELEKALTQLDPSVSVEKSKHYSLDPMENPKTDLGKR